MTGGGCGDIYQKQGPCSICGNVFEVLLAVDGFITKLLAGVLLSPEGAARSVGMLLEAASTIVSKVSVVSVEVLVATLSISVLVSVLWVGAEVLSVEVLVVLLSILASVLWVESEVLLVKVLVVLLSKSVPMPLVDSSWH